MQPEYSIIVPGLNEAENLKVLIPRLKHAFDATGNSYEVLFVNNASTDNTDAVISSFMHEMPQLKLLSEPTRGYGRAVRKGLAASTGKYIGIIRSDNQEKPEDLVRMFALLENNGADLYKAIRLHRMNEGLQRVVISFVFNTLFKLMFRLRSIDINASPKIFTRALYEEARLESNDFFIDAELVIKAEKLGRRVEQLGIEYYPRLEGKSTVRMKHIFEFLNNMNVWRKRVRAGRLFS
ncbi:MAG: dolichol-phosphate mannosyltransferase [Parcubacteria bacterium C7867-001]|nr:MAG: dolichol-phosphate mannosyltransferase [Parcubacteria bacterium C7867-001]